MPRFSIRARRRTGELTLEDVEAADQAAAISAVSRRGLFVVRVEGVRGAKAGSERASAKSSRTVRTGGMPGQIREWFKRPRRPKLQDLATFTQQLANLLKAGMPLTVALNSMSHLDSKGISAEVGRRLKQDVMEGKSLSDAMKGQRHVFSDFYINMVRAGEQSGALTDVLNRLAAHFERFAEVQQKFVSALIYPAVVCCVGVVIIIFFMTFMLPKFLSIFDGMKVELPAATKMLVTMSNLFSGYWWVLPLVAVALVIVYDRYRRSDGGRRVIDQFKIKAPVLGNVMRLNLFGQFARTLGTLLHNGVPVLTALQITEDIISNQIIKEAIRRTRQEVTDGKTIAQPLAKSGIFPQLMIDLIKIGEETGDVPGALNNVASTYENELSVALRVMTNLIEPAMIIVMAMGVGFLLFSVLSAMFAITANIAR
jgi:type II secretory pathway component PulF